MIFSFLETFALFAGLVYVLLQVKQSIWMWPVDILCCMATIAVFAHQHLWASMGLNIYYLVMGVVGISAWKKDEGQVQEGVLRLRRLSLRAALYSLAGFAFSCAVLFFALGAAGDSAVVPDAFIGASGVIGTVWLVKSYPQNWLVWIISDIVSTLLCYTQGLYPMAALYLVYTVVAVVGWIKWRRDGRYIG